MSTESNLYFLIQKISNSIHSKVAQDDITALRLGIQNLVGKKPDYIPNVWYSSNDTSADFASSPALVSKQLYLAPMSFNNDVTIDSIGYYVSTAVAKSTFKLYIYESDANGYPTNLVFLSPDLSGDATGLSYKDIVGDKFVFKAGATYWYGVVGAGGLVFHGIPCENMKAMGITSDTHKQMNAVVKLIDPNNPPKVWGFDASQLTNISVFPALRMKIGKAKYSQRDSNGNV